MGVADLSIGAPDTPEVAADALDGGAASRTEGRHPGPELLDGGDLDLAPEVDELVVRTLLSSMGGMLHVAIGDEDVPEHWEFTPRELDQLTPPLTRWVNRQPRLRKAVAHGDELAVGVALASYAGRNITAAQQARAARDEEGNDAHVDREAPGPAGPAGAAPGGPHGFGPGRHGGPDGHGVHPAAGGGLR